MALLLGAVLVYSVGFIAFWESFSHRAQESRRRLAGYESYTEHLRSDLASLEVKLKEAEEKASDYEGRLPEEREVYQPSVVEPSTGPRVRLEKFSDRIQRNGMDLYVDGYYEFKDEEAEKQEDKSQE